MRRILAVFVAGVLAVSLFSRVSQAEDIEDINVITDMFYGGLADIIERNMDDPDFCVREVDAYYQRNWATVEKIRQLAEKQMEEAQPMLQEKMKEEMSKESMMTEEERETYHREQMEIARKRMSPEGIRYDEAWRAFTAKYPEQGVIIGAKIMALMPSAQKIVGSPQEIMPPEVLKELEPESIQE